MNNSKVESVFICINFYYNGQRGKRGDNYEYY